MTPGPLANGVAPFEIALDDIAGDQFFEENGARNYTFWSFIGQRGPGVDVIGPDVPLSNGVCNGGFAPGLVYQKLSQETGGSRYPTCGASPDYEKMFALMAASAIEQTKGALPIRHTDSAGGQDIDLESIEIEWTPGDADTPDEPGQIFRPIAAGAVCGSEGGLYVDPVNNDVVLCPASCSVVSARDRGQVDVRWGCDLNIK